MSSFFHKLKKGAKDEAPQAPPSAPVPIPPGGSSSNLQPPHGVQLSSSPTRSSTVPPPLPPSPQLQPLPPSSSSFSSKPTISSPPPAPHSLLLPPQRPPLPASPPGRTTSLSTGSSPGSTPPSATPSSSSPPSPQPQPPAGYPPTASQSFFGGFWNHGASNSAPSALASGLTSGLSSLSSTVTGRAQSVLAVTGGRGPVPATQTQSLPGPAGSHYYPNTNMSPSSSYTTLPPASVPAPATSAPPPLPPLPQSSSDYKQPPQSHDFSAYPSAIAASAQSPAQTTLDDVCRTAMSWEVDDQLVAARLFLEQTQHGDERQHDELVNKALPALLRLMASSNTSVQTHAIQTIALLARHPKYHERMQSHHFIRSLLDQLQLCRDARVLEALLAALTHLAKSHSHCTTICDRGLPSLLPLLDMKYASSVGVQCNTLALIGALAAFPSLQDHMINHDILHHLYALRDSHTQQPDIKLNAQFCLKVMGYTDEDPTQAHLDVLNAAVGMGFPRGRCEHAIRTVRMNRGNEAADDMQAVSTYLLDHFNEPPPAALIAVGGGAELHRSIDSSAHQAEERRHEAAMRKEKLLGIKRVAKERCDDVRALLEIGFTRKEAILSLYYQNTIDSAIEWIFKRREWKKERTQRGAAAAGAGGRDARDDEDDEEAKEEQMERERSASKESGYDSDGLTISEFEDDGAGERKRSDDDWSEQQHALPSTVIHRTSSVPPPPSSSHPHHSGAISEPALPAIPPHNRSQSVFPTVSGHGHGSSKYATLPTPLPGDDASSLRVAPSSSASLPSTPSPASPSSGDPRRQQERAAMVAWLSSHNLSDYVQAFTEQQISVNTLHRLTDGDLKDLGMKKLGDRKKFQMVVEAYEKQQRDDRSREDGAVKPRATSDKLPSLPSDEEIAPVSDLRPQSPIEHSVRPPQPAAEDAEAMEHEDGAASEHASAVRKGFVDFAFLQSMPLKHSEVPGISKKLDLSKETMELQAALNESGKQFRVGWEIATKDNLLKMMAYSRALHISGHGDPNALVLEDGKGDLATLPVDKLQKILSVGGTQLQFVFVSACFSSRAAYAFAVAGVPHVIAVQEDTQVTDTSARAFAHHVYLALCQGLTVREAFTKGQAAVIAANSYNPPCCCAHLHPTPLCSICDVCRTPVCCPVHAAPCHASKQGPRCCQPTIPHDESLKFLLLPIGGNHDVPLFRDADVPDGQWINKTPPKPPNNLPSGPDDFMGRAKDALAIVPQVLRHRLFLITGARGIGKSALARAVATYINDRRHFYAAYLLKLHDASTTVQIDVALAKVLKIAYDGNQLERVHDLVVHHLKYTKTDNKPFLFVFDDCDLLVGDEGRIDGEEKEQTAPAGQPTTSSQSKRAFRQYISSFLDDTPSHIIITSDSSPGSMDGHTLRVRVLSGLHALDLAALFVNRLPRDIKPDDLRQHLQKVTSLNDLLPHPLFTLMAGLPRMAEWCAELLNYTNMDQLYSLLSCEPVVDSRRASVVLSNPAWPASLPEEAKLLLRKCQALMIAREGGIGKVRSAEKEKDSRSVDSAAPGGARVGQWSGLPVLTFAGNTQSPLLPLPPQVLPVLPPPAVATASSSAPSPLPSLSSTALPLPPLSSSGLLSSLPVQPLSARPSSSSSFTPLNATSVSFAKKESSPPRPLLSEPHAALRDGRSPSSASPSTSTTSSPTSAASLSPAEGMRTQSLSGNR